VGTLEADASHIHLRLLRGRDILRPGPQVLLAALDEIHHLLGPLAVPGDLPHQPDGAQELLVEGARLPVAQDHHRYARLLLQFVRLGRVDQVSHEDHVRIHAYQLLGIGR
jgi:hypothetical protein